MNNRDAPAIQRIFQVLAGRLGSYRRVAVDGDEGELRARDVDGGAIGGPDVDQDAQPEEPEHN